MEQLKLPFEEFKEWFDSLTPEEQEEVRTASMELLATVIAEALTKWDKWEIFDAWKEKVNAKSKS